MVARAAENLRDGTSVVVRAPAHTPGGLATAIREAHESDWRTLDEHLAESSTVAELLIDRFDPHMGHDQPRNTRSVVDSERLRGHALMVEVASGSTAWARWRDFLSEYAEFARSLAPYERTVFCALVVGSEETALPRDSVCLAIDHCSGAAGELDMALYVANRLRHHPEPRLAARARASVITRLALWDPAVADRLAEAPLSQVFEPEHLLLQIAAERAWTPERVAAEGGWLTGMSGHWEDREHLHSAGLASLGKTGELRNRVWSGQVGVLFPALEEQRRALIDRFERQLSVPHRTLDGRIIQDRRDLELGHIIYQLRSDGRAPDRRVLHAIQSLVDMRNALSHFEVVPADMISDPEVQGLT